MATKVKSPEVTFTSRYQRKTYLIGEEPRMDQRGSAITVSSGYRRIEFQQGTFTTDDPETIDWLCEHPDFGNEIFRADQPGAYIPVDDSTVVVGEVQTTKANQPRPRTPGPVATNIVE
jgi:hypothetical protein